MKCALVLVLVVVCSTAGWGVQLEGARSVRLARGPIPQDVVAAGSTVAIQPKVVGDVAAVGNVVEVEGPVKDSVMAAGKDVSVSGSVGNDVWLAGNTVELTSSVADSAYLAGADVSLSDDSSVGGDLLVAGDNLHLMGKVGKNVRAAGSELVIGGTVNGDVIAEASTIRLLSTAVIKGNFHYKSANPATIDSGARVVGATSFTRTKEGGEGHRFLSGFVSWFLRLLAAVIFGAVLVTLFPARSAATADTVRAAFWPSLGVGCLALVVVPIAAILLLITLIGIPLSVALTFGYIVLLYAGGVLTALSLGRAILARGGTEPKLLGAMVLGVLVIGLVSLVPFLGRLVKLVAVLSGFGAFLMSWWRSRESAPAAPPPTAPA